MGKRYIRGALLAPKRMYPMFSKWSFGRLARLVCFALLLSALPASANKNPPERPIDLNAANMKELEELPGVGPTTAQAILDFREKNGRFKRVEDLLVIRGISAGKLQKMRPYLTVSAPPKLPENSASPAAGKPAPVKPQQTHPAATAPSGAHGYQTH
jgi:comEA protein